MGEHVLALVWRRHKIAHTGACEADPLRSRLGLRSGVGCGCACVLSYRAGTGCRLQPSRVSRRLRAHAVGRLVTVLEELREGEDDTQALSAHPGKKWGRVQWVAYPRHILQRPHVRFQAYATLPRRAH